VINGTTFEGLPALPASDDAVRLAAIPAWGGTVAGFFDRRQGRDLALEPCLGALDTLDTAVYHWNECKQNPATGSLTRWLEMTLC
jgi:hypothetical protein